MDANNWQPIDTAPTDGTPILGCDADGNRFVTAWTNDAYRYNGGNGGPSGWFSGEHWDVWGDRPRMDNPVYWMVIPNAPLSCGNRSTV